MTATGNSRWVLALTFKPHLLAHSAAEALPWGRIYMRSLFFLLLIVVFSVRAQETNIVLDAGLHHLGEKEVKAFPEANRKAEAPSLEVAFESQSNQTEWTLQLKQRDVSEDWNIALNGKPLGRLNIGESERVSHYPVPAYAIQDGANTLAILPKKVTDDVLVGAIELAPRPMRDVLKLGHVTLTITDLTGKIKMPARIVVANAAGKFADLYNIQPSVAAWRRGIIYNAAETVEFDLPEGQWTITATRGVEYSRAQAPVRIFYGQKNTITLPIFQQVDTTGYIAVDSHLHTYTFSGHGDASVDERIITLAGEGVEMAIATDHNHFTDYQPRQAALGSSPYFTSVIGNEVTTANGHFNGFPFKVDSEKPNHKETNWVKLVADIRSKGAQYVILNHPRWPTITNSPFSIWGVNRTTGSRTNDMQFTVDAIELVNSSVPTKGRDFMLRDWFALLSRGERLWGVGASDSHTIADPPGQGRTYVPSSTDDPAAINVEAVIKQMQAGNMSVSYGLFATATANGAKMGSMIAPTNDQVVVNFHVACASWIPAKLAVAYLNGIKVAQTELSMMRTYPLSTNITFKIPAPKHDAFLVCAAFGDGVKDPSWKTLQDYTLAIANPFWIDADGDGKYTAPRETALALLEKMGKPDLAKIEAALAEVDAAIGVQMIAEAKLRLPAEQLPDWDRLLEKMSLKDDLYLFYRTPSAMK